MFSILINWFLINFFVSVRGISTAHPNCVLFVTHGGYNSLIEVTWAGVPVLCIPIFSDQFHNAQIFEESGVGKLLYQDQLTEVILAETVDSIIHDSK